MPELTEEIKAVSPKTNLEESALLTKLFEYTEERYNPWRKGYLLKVAECYNFKELLQWDGADAALLAKLDVPAVPIDRINRGLDTIDGIRKNSNLKKKIVKKELGDEQTATLLEKVSEHVRYQGDFDAVDDDVFGSLRDVGMGIKKAGFDPQANNGDGEIWIESVNVEDFGSSKCKKKDLSDLTWCWHHQVMGWEDAMMIAPERASELKGMKVNRETEWEKIKGGNVQGAATADYNNTGVSDPQYTYPDQVDVWEFWRLHRIPLKKIGSVDFVPDPNGVPMPVPKVNEAPIDYKIAEGEQELGTFIKQEWNQYIVAGNQKSCILLKQDVDDDHPFIGYIAKKKKSGQPTGYIEEAIPAQRRIGLAWAMKMAFYTKAIKAALVIKNAQNTDVSSMIHASSLGSILFLPLGADVVSMNTNPPINFSAVEEGNVARADMDFAVAATEDALRGVSEAGTSGIKLSLQQNAAVTPLNKWTSAFMQCEKTATKKILKLIIRHIFSDPYKVARIIGEEMFVQMGGIKFPPDVLNYDVVIEDQALSDFNKQQSFNSVETLVGGGVVFEDTFRIKNAPIKDLDGALASNLQARQDVIRMLMMQVDALQKELDMATKPSNGSPNRKPSQPANARAGANAPQTKQRMLGGTSPSSPGNR